MTKINASNLTFEESRQDLISTLKANPAYKDYNFDASGINTIISLLANNETKLGFYVKMLLDETNADAFKTEESMYAHSNNDRFLPKGFISSKSTVKLKLYVLAEDNPLNSFISINRGTTISSNNDATDTRTFNIMEPVNATDSTIEGNYVTYITDDIDIQEGKLQTWSFLMDDAEIDQEFIIKEDNIDISTLRVRIKESEESTKFTEYKKVDTIVDINPNDNIFYITVNYNGYYKIFFGNNIIGNKPRDKSVIECEYLTCSGYKGNGSKNFTFNDNLTTVDTIIQKVDVISEKVSWGGSDPHNIEENRFLLKNQKKEQNRCTTAEDYASKITKMYGNIEAINSWGGEENIHKLYGKTCISIKPIFADKITDNAKEYIRSNITTPYGHVGNDIVFVDPEFINIHLKMSSTINSNLTNLSLASIDSAIESETKMYNDNLKGFNKNFSAMDLGSHLKYELGYIKKINIEVNLSKTVDVINGSKMSYDVVFGNKIDTTKPIYTDNMYYGLDSSNKVCRLEMLENKIRLVDTNGDIMSTEVFGKIIYIGDQAVINFTLPKYLKTSIYVASNNLGSVTWHISPVETDIESYNNNILRINSIRSIATPDSKKG